ncbi:MAG: class I adenylate cyclase [Gammaproteobacteria bacterium]
MDNSPASEKKHLTPVLLGSPGEDISKKDLDTVIKRFKNLHLLQQKRIQNFLQHRQRAFLNLLPLLFHQNTPLLPGFVSSEVPAGIRDYVPTRETLLDAAHFSKNFVYKNKALPSYPIWGLFLMGSVSSIAFSKTSDMDIWLCHQPGLGTAELAVLQQKAAEIERWAETLALEVHFFLIDSDRFRNGEDTPISSESSGTTQHYLLLEEFYRTSVYIAGRIPAWWVVPPHEERRCAAYIRHLLEHRFIADYDIIDFGSLEQVPAEEFITATLWHLYKAISSPHKSLLKLLLMECYASEYPDIEWLCADMKKMVYQGNFTLEELDPYLLIQKKLENYLTQAQSVDRLELARQSFFIKIVGFGDTEHDQQKRFCRAEFIKTIARRWHWPEQLLPELSRQETWNIRRAAREHGRILRHLSECFRMIVGFAGRHVQTDYKDNEDLKLIGRKLHSFLENKPGKIELISTQSILQVKENELSLVETGLADGKTGWGLFIGKADTDNHGEQRAIKNSWNLIDLLAWLIVNGLYHKQLQLSLSTRTLTVNDHELQATVRQLHAFITERLSGVSNALDHFKAPNKNLYTHIFVNVGIEPDYLRKTRLLRLSERSDPFSYGKNRLCFVETTDTVMISSWGEITTRHLTGLDGLFNVFIDILNNHRDPISEDDITLICNTSMLAKSISQRAGEVFRNLVELKAAPGHNIAPRYILPGGSDFYIFQRINNAIRFHSMHSQAELLKELGQAQEFFCPTRIESGCLENSVIPILYKYNRANEIQIYFFAAKSTVLLYIVDEKGSLFFQHYPQARVDPLLNRYGAFLINIINRNFFDARIAVEYYEIRHNPFAIVPYTPLPPERTLPHELNIRVFGEQINNVSSYTLYCNEYEFSTLEHGPQVIHAAARYILEFRQTRQNYPIHISDIDVPATSFGYGNPEKMQTIDFLKLKQKIEARLNSAATLDDKDGNH